MTTADPAKGSQRLESTGTITYTAGSQTQTLYNVVGGKVWLVYAGHRFLAAWGSTGIKDMQFQVEESSATTNISDNEAVESAGAGSWFVIDGTTASTGLFVATQEVGQSSSATAGNFVLNEGTTVQVVTAGPRTGSGRAHFSVIPLTPGARLEPQL